MRILILSEWFDPEPVFKGLVFAKELVRRGNSVQVLTTFPNYPGGKVYPGYRIRPWRKEVVDGVEIIRVAAYPSHDKSALKRVATYISFALSAAALGPVLVKKPDVIYVYHPPATIGFPAIVLQRLWRVPVVYDIQDLWPESVAVSGMMSNDWAIRTLRRWCDYVHARADRVVVLSPGFKRALESRGVPSGKIRVIYNWCDEASLSASGRDEKFAESLGLAGRFNVMFAGTMGICQALDAVLEAAERVWQVSEKVQFVFVGGGTDRERLIQRCEAMKLRNVLFLPRQPLSEMGRLLALADVALVHLKDDPLFKITIPGKTQAYLAAGKPILMAVGGDATELVRMSSGGIACAPESASGLAEAVLDLASLDSGALRKLGEAGRRFYESSLSLSVGTGKFCDTFEELCGRVACGREQVGVGAGPQ